MTARECLTLAGPLLRGELSILAGRLAMVLRMHSGRRSSIDPASLVPPDSPLARDAEVAAQDLLTPALLNHSRRAYTWGAAIAALHGITFDRELLYLTAMFHDTGIPSPVPDVDFTVRSAAVAREFTDSHHVPADLRELGPSTFPSPGVIGERHFFFHVEVDPTKRKTPPEDGSLLEHAAVIADVPLTEALAACRAGEVEDAKTELALRRLADIYGA